MDSLSRSTINSRNCSSETENGVATGKLDTFRRKSRTLLYLFPRRCAIALMLFLLLSIKHQSTVNIERFILEAIYYSDTSISVSWTRDGYHNYELVYYLTFIFAQIPGSLLIFTLSSHRFLFISAIGSSIIHQFMPLAASRHTISFLVLIVCEKCFEAPVVVAIMATWKDWSPQWERTRLIMFSIFGIFVTVPALLVIQPPFFIHHSHFYILGVAGLVWALIWHILISDIPKNDPLISPNELIYLDSSIPSENRQKKSLKDVPWKSVITSKQIAILCIIFLKMSFSYVAVFYGMILCFRDTESFSVFYVFVPVFAIVMLGSAIVSDFLIKSERPLLIRKIFLCGALTLQSSFMIGVIMTSGKTKAIFFAISYVMYAASLSGCITLPLDLSPRYVALITGILFTFYYIGETCIIFLYAEKRYRKAYEDGMDAVNDLFLLDGIISLVCAGIFAVCGDVGEQLWFFSSTSVRESSKRSGNDLELTNKCDANSEPENA